MRWEEKLSHIQELCEVSLCMRKPGNWYVNTHELELKYGYFLVSPTVSGKSPADAVNLYWKIITTLRDGDDQYDYIVLNGRRERRHVCWNGVRWMILGV